MSGVQNLEVAEGDAGQRLDRFLKRQIPEINQIQIEKACRKGEIRIDGKRAKPSARVEAGNLVRVPPVQVKTGAPQKQTARISDKDRDFIRQLVLYKDNDIIVLNKPSGLATQGGTKTKRHVDGLAEGLKFELEKKPMLVHRLDRDTSGILVLARHRQAAQSLAKSFHSKRTEKTYWAVVAGVPNPREGRISLALAKMSGHGKSGEGEKMQIVEREDFDATEGAKHAVTDFLVLETAGTRLSLLAMSPVTGRTHQLRAHAAAIGHPIVGDGKYGGSSRVNEGDGWGAGIGGEMQNQLHLHAHALKFPHPISGKMVNFIAPLPPHMEKSFALFGWGIDEDYDEQFREARALM